MFSSCLSSFCPLQQPIEKAEIDRIRTELQSEDYDTKRLAKTRLRHLGTKDAVREMLADFEPFDNTYGSDYSQGLFASPHREFVIDKMEAALIAPDQAVSDSFIWTLVKTKQDNEEQQAPLQGDAAETWQARNKKHERIESDYYRQLATALPRKRGRARAVSMATLLRALDNGESTQPDWVKDLRESLPKQIVQNFGDLPPGMQGDFLTHHWRLLRPHADPEVMLPVLREIYVSKDPAMRDVPKMALGIIYELAPQEGRELLLKEIANNKESSLYAHMMMFLPDETLPDLDNDLARNVETTPMSGHPWSDRSCRLLERYATGSVLTRVKKVYDEERSYLSNDGRSALVAYFLRVDPSYGASKAEELLSKGQGRGRVISRIAELHYCPEFEPLVVAALFDADNEFASEAARVLMIHGSPETEKELWRRYSQWHETWKGKIDQLQREAVPRTKTNWGAVQLGAALADALVFGRNWLANKDDIMKVQSLMLCSQDKEQMGYSLDCWEQAAVPIVYRGSNYSWGSVDIAHYSHNSLEEAKRKLQQFPKGTKFRWRWHGDKNNVKAAEVKAELSGILIERGMTLSEPDTKL